MDTYDQMFVDNEKYLYNSDPSLSQTQQQPMLSKDEDGSGPLGRRVYLESPTFDNQEEEDMYRYVPSRLTDRTASIIGPAVSMRRTAAKPVDAELDMLGANRYHADIFHQQESQPIETRRQPSNTLLNRPRADPRQDPLLGPLLAELDAISNQQLRLSPPPPPLPPIYRRNSLPYEPNPFRTIGSSQPNHALTNIANRTVTDALLEAQLSEPFDRRDHQRHPTLPYSAPNINSSQRPSRPADMDETDLFLQSSYSANPGSFLSHFGPEDQLFHRPLLHTFGQNYVPNPRLPPHQPRQMAFDQPYTHQSPAQRPTYTPSFRPLPPPSQQHDTTFDQTHTHASPTPHTNYAQNARPPLPQQRDMTFDHTHAHLPPAQRTNYAPPPLNNQQNPNPFIEYQRMPPPQHFEEQQVSHRTNPSNAQDMFFTDQNEDHQQQSSMPSERSYDPDSKRQAVWNQFQRTSAKTQEKNAKKRQSANQTKGAFGSTLPGSHQSSALVKSPPRPFRQPPPFSKSNYVEENIDMIRNKENSYHRYPTTNYENSFTKRKDFHSGSLQEKSEQEPRQRQSSLPVTANQNPNEQSSPATMTIPLDSHINRNGDKISVNIDLRLVDLQNLKQPQGTDRPQWSTFDPLDRHIRKLERNIDQTLPITHMPQRSPIIPSTGMNPAGNRYGRPLRVGYNPPIYSDEQDRSRDEGSYLAKLNYAKKSPQFKPYTGRDYEQFKKNYGFGTGHLGSNFDSTTLREKTDKATKTRVYAQQIEARNKKKLTDVARRTYSDSRVPFEASKPPRPFEYTQVPIRGKRSAHASAPILTGIVPFIPARRPTEVLHRPPPPPPKENIEIVEREKSLEIPSVHKEPQRSHTNQRRLSPAKPLPVNTDIKRRPIRFDQPPPPNSLPPQNSNPNLLTDEENKVIEVIRQELKEQPLTDTL